MVTLDVDREASAESVGRPLEGVEVRALADGGSPLPPGAEGELAVRSPWAASWRITTSGWQPVADASGWIRMKDVGRLDPHGRLYLTGNNGTLINVAGRKVNPVEVEVALMSHPKVRDAAVIPLRDSYGEQAVQAVVVSSEACTMDELLTFCRERLADYQVPRVIQFRNALPRSPAGKVLRQALG
jgi:long-chain acyl-CoA synthetase